ncbi:putative phage tail protein [Aneurinibacillus aneurinilyticus]|uniref:putative phage tail protein n=1 Tax=Aneurinibacillus aneurinilyticus TaxID=1391 RepID=UPI00366F637F
MNRKERMIAQMPSNYHKDPLTHELKNAEAMELDRVRAQRQDVFLQFDPATATWGIANWEKIFGIPIDETKPLQERREVVIGRMRFSDTVSVAKIKNVASAWSGGEVDVKENYERFAIEIKFIGKRGIPANMNDIKRTLRELIPAHLGIDYYFTYTVWSEVKSKTWGALKNYSWKEVREREMV